MACRETRGQGGEGFCSIQFLPRRGGGWYLPPSGSVSLPVPLGPTGSGVREAGVETTQTVTTLDPSHPSPLCGGEKRVGRVPDQPSRLRVSKAYIIYQLLNFLLCLLDRELGVVPVGSDPLLLSNSRVKVYEPRSTSRVRVCCNSDRTRFWNSGGMSCGLEAR